MNRTINGAPVHNGDAWVVYRLAADGTHWFPLAHTVRTTRAAAIKHVNRTFYERCRRAGTMRAARVALLPICIPASSGRRSR